MRALHIVLLCLLPVYAVMAEGVPGTVKASLLNVRAKPSTKFSVLCQVPNGESVTVLFEQDGWYNIVAPAHSAAWISGNVVDGDGTVSRIADVFAGPSASHTVYAKVAVGTQVDVKNRRDDNWLQIAVPKTATAWVSARYIEAENVRQVAGAVNTTSEPVTLPVAPPVPEVVVKPPPSTAPKVAPPAPAPKVVTPAVTIAVEPPKEVVNPKVVELPPEETPVAKEPEAKSIALAINAVDIDLPPVVPKDIRVHPINFEPNGDEMSFIGTPKSIEKAGVVLRLAEKEHPRAFVIAMRVHDTYYPVAYLQSETEKLEDWEFHRARVFGTQQVVDQWPRPLIQVERIEKLNP